MRRREFITPFGGAAMPWPLRAQQAAKPPTVGLLCANTLAAQSQWTAAFVQRLRAASPALTINRNVIGGGGAPERLR